jgi:hypothetical protein
MFGINKWFKDMFSTGKKAGNKQIKKADNKSVKAPQVESEPEQTKEVEQPVVQEAAKPKKKYNGYKRRTRKKAVAAN